jgi:hypothetical protein
VALSQSWLAHDGRRDDRTLTDVSAITPDRDAPHVVAVNNEAEVTGVVESLDLGGGPSGVAVLFDVAHVEREVVAHELAVARGSDRVRSYELPALVVQDRMVDERGEERVGVVGVRRVEQSGDGSWGPIRACRLVYPFGPGGVNGHPRPIAT